MCGLSSRAPKDDSFKEIMGYYLTSPCWVEKREVPGWKGFHTWYFVCTHRDSASLELELFRQDFLLRQISQAPEWRGGSFRVPFK